MKKLKFFVKLLQPLAKLSYTIFLLRAPVIYYRYTSVRYTYGLYYWKYWRNCFLDYVIAAFFAFFLYILFEAPSINIIKIFENYRNLEDNFENQNETKNIENSENDHKVPDGESESFMPESGKIDYELDESSQSQIHNNKTNS